MSQDEKSAENEELEKQVSLYIDEENQDKKEKNQEKEEKRWRESKEEETKEKEENKAENHENVVKAKEKKKLSFTYSKVATTGKQLKD